MSTPVEHDYIGLSETCTMESSSGKNNNVLNLKETELRLGLPGSESPERKAGLGVSLFGKDLEDNKTSGFSLSPLKNFVSGAKRGFSDAIDGSGKWALSVNDGSAIDLPNGSVLFSPRGGDGGLENNTIQKSCLPAGFSMKEASMTSPSKPAEEKKMSPTNENVTAPASTAQVVGWPPIRSFRKNKLATNLSKSTDVAKGNSSSGCIYVKVSMDGAPYLRKVDLKTYCNYAELSSALEKMFSCFTIVQCTSDGLPEQDGLSASGLMDLVHGSEYVLTYEDKDGDWMLVGDVPWDMFTDSCKRLRIMKGSEAIGLAPRAMEKCRNQQ